MDLAPYTDFNLDKMSGYLRDARPDIQILPVSTKSGDGLEAWLAVIETALERKQAAPSA